MNGTYENRSTIDNSYTARKKEKREANKPVKLFKPGDPITIKDCSGYEKRGTGMIGFGEGTFTTVGHVQGTITEGIPNHDLSLLKGEIGGKIKYFLYDTGDFHTVENINDEPVVTQRVLGDKKIEVNFVEPTK